METAELVEKIDQVFNRKKQANEEAFRKRFPRDHRYVSQKMLSFVPKPASLKSDIGSGSIGEPLGPENVLTLPRAVDSILKPGGPSSKESASNQACQNFYL